MAASVTMMNVARIAGPASYLERGLSTGQQSPLSVTQAFLPLPVSLLRSKVKHRVATRRNVICAEANSRDSSRPGSEGPGQIKQTVKREVGVSTGKAQPGGSDSSVTSGQTDAQTAGGLHHEDPNSFPARQLNLKSSTDSVSDSSEHWQAATDANIPTSFNKLGNNRSELEAKKQHEVSDAVSGTMSYAQVAENLRHEKPKAATDAGIPTSFNKLGNNRSEMEAKKQHEVSDAVSGTMSYAQVAENLRHEKPKAGPIRSEVLERTAPKEQERAAPKKQVERDQSEERPFKESRQDGELNLESSKRSFNFKSLAAIVTALFLAFALAPVWSPVVGKVLTPFFQLVGVAVAVKFFVTDFLRADKRKELYKKGEQLKEDIKG